MCSNRLLVNPSRRAATRSAAVRMSGFVLFTYMQRAKLLRFTLAYISRCYDKYLPPDTNVSKYTIPAVLGR